MDIASYVELDTCRKCKHVDFDPCDKHWLCTADPDKQYIVSPSGHCEDYVKAED